MFIRVHHSYLVNSKYIAAIHKSIQSIELINGTYLKISRSKKQFLNTTIKNTLS
jgi:DNA-binding LytR/AlgR family response regulator